MRLLEICQRDSTHIRVTQKSIAERDGIKKSIEPRMFQLTANYRSHGGIVDCANTITATIIKLWPDMIDKVDREAGTVGGNKPLFLRSGVEELLFADRCMRFMNDSVSKTEHIPFVATIP